MLCSRPNGQHGAIRRDGQSQPVRPSRSSADLRRDVFVVAGPNQRAPRQNPAVWIHPQLPSVMQDRQIKGLVEVVSATVTAYMSKGRN